MFKTIIAGSRDIISLELVEMAYLSCPWQVIEIVSGGARGVDSLGEAVAQKYNIPVKRFPANWNKYGSAAGPIRNVEMACYAEALIAVWDGVSRGTNHMIGEAKKRNFQIQIFTPKELEILLLSQKPKLKRPRFT